MPGPRRQLGGGGGRKKTQKLIDAARLMLEAIEDQPELAKSVHPIVDSLTKVIRHSVTAMPPSLDGITGGPALDASPTEAGGAEPENLAPMIARMLPGT